MDEQIGNYKIFRLLGKGGMGAAYLCSAEDFGESRKVVVKELLEEHLSPEQRVFAETLFQEEALSLLRVARNRSLDVILEAMERTGKLFMDLTTDEVVGLYELFCLEQQLRYRVPELLNFFRLGTRMFLVQEYVEGETLDNYLQRKGPLSWEETAQLLLQLFKILEGAHSREIIHCDVKPPNIIYGPDGLITLIDFGIARQLGQLKFGDLIRATGATPGFAAPEQRLGYVVPSSDLYASGVTAAVLLAGIHSQSMHFENPDIAASVLRGIDPGVLPALGRSYLEKLIRNDPSLRFQTALEAREVLQAVILRTSAIPRVAKHAPFQMPMPAIAIKLFARAASVFTGSRIS